MLDIYKRRDRDIDECCTFASNMLLKNVVNGEIQMVPWSESFPGVVLMADISGYNLHFNQRTLSIPLGIKYFVFERIHKACRNMRPQRCSRSSRNVQDSQQVFYIRNLLSIQPCVKLISKPNYLSYFTNLVNIVTDHGIHAQKKNLASIQQSINPILPSAGGDIIKFAGDAMIIVWHPKAIK